MAYCDTSVIIATLTHEEHSPIVWQWLQTIGDRPVFVSDWVDTEVASALSMKVRTRQIDAGNRADVWAAWRSAVEQSYVRLDVTARDFASAARLLERHNLGLRAGDALHLAIALERAVPIATLDKRMADAAAAIGVDVEALV